MPSVAFMPYGVNVLSLYIQYRSASSLSCKARADVGGGFTNCKTQIET